MKYCAKLYCNDGWANVNEIQEVKAEGYKHVEVHSAGQFKVGSKILFTITETATVYGTYVITSDGDLAWHQRFQGAPFVIPGGGGTIQVEFALN